MKEKQYHPVIRNSLIILLASFAFILIANYFLTSYFFNSIEQGQYLVNIAGKNRTLSQRILIESQRLIAEGNENLKVTLNEYLTDYSKILMVLRKGGTITVDGQEVKISQKADERILPTLERVEKLWKAYKDTASIIVTEPLYVAVNPYKPEQSLSLETDLEKIIEESPETKRVINPHIKAALGYVSEKAPEVLQLNEQLIDQYLEVVDARRKNADILVLIITLVSVLFMVIAFFVIRSVVLRPMQLIASAAEDIAEGNTTQPIEYEFTNEVGAIVKGMNRMVNSLQNATTFIQNIGKGNLDITYQGVNEQTDFEHETLAGALLAMREQMRRVTREEQQRKWATEGLSLFVDILRNNNDNLNALSHEIIENVVKYVGAIQGGIYILEEEDNRSSGSYAELIAAYAYDRHKILKQRIYPHEGIIGQVILDGDTIYIDDIPAEYSDIVSGLGGSKPRNVLVVPLKLNEILVGIMELASFKTLETYQIDFLERLANNIASTIANVKVNEKTRTLLDEQRHAAQQMRIQEEELRQNVEELQATQEEMNKNEAALAGQSFAITASLLSAEYDMEGKVIMANGLFLDAFSYELNDLRGKHHRVLLDTQTSYGEEYLKFWDALKVGRVQSGEYKRITRKGEEVWLRAAYVPIANKRGDLYKVICLAFDITEQKQEFISYLGQIEALRRIHLILEFDLQGFITEANQKFLELFRYDRFEIVGRHYNFLLGMDEGENDEYKIKWRQFKGGNYDLGQYKYQNKSEDPLWLQGSFNPVFDLNGNAFKVLFIADDITEQKESEFQTQETQRVLKLQQENLTNLINNNDDRLMAVDKYYFVTVINNSFKNTFQQLGRDIEVGVNILDTFPEDRYEILKSPYDRALAGEKVRTEEVYIGSKGEELSLLVIYTPILDDEDNVQGVTIFARDTSEIKRNQEKLLQAQRKIEETEADLRALINNSEDRLYSIGKQYQLIAFNEVISQVVQQQFSIKISVGDNALEKLHPPKESNFWKSLYDRVLKGDRFKVQATPPESHLKYEIAANPILDSNKNIVGGALFVRIL